MNAELTRRALMKGVSLGAGATLLGPALDALAAHAAGDAAKVAPRRVVFIVQSNGMSPAHVMPTDVARPRNGRPTNDLTEELTLKGRRLHEAVEAFAPFQERIALLHGLSGRIAVSDHSANHGALGAYPANKGPMAQTVDSALADALPGIFPHVALGYGGEVVPMSYAYSASGAGKAVPTICSPDLAFKALFGSVAGGAGRQAFDRRSNLLDFMADDVRRSRAALAGEEREKFDRYVEAYESLHARQTLLLAKAEDLRRHAPKLGDKADSTTSSIILEAQFETAAAALVAGLTNVVTLVSGGGGQRFGKYPEFGILDLHGIGHGGGYDGRTSEQCFVELRKFHAKLIAGLVKRLSEAKEGDGTVLDNTLIVYFSDSGEGHHPSLYEWPVVLIGDLGGRLKSRGRFLQFPKYGAKGHRTMANLWLTLLQAAGKPRDKFGVADVGLKDIDQTGPIGELLA